MEFAVQIVVRKDVRGWLGATALLASLVGLSACPQVLQDDFGARVLADDAGAGSCVDEACAGGADGSGPDASSSGAPTAPDRPDPPEMHAPPTPKDPPTPPTTPDPPPVTTPDVSLGPDCWVVDLSDPTHDATGNCLDIHGWNEVVTDATTTPATAITRTYQGGSICLQGTIEPGGWGAVYNLTFANEGPWDAASFGVGGFRLAASGEALPPQIKVVYTASSDFCRLVTPTADTRIPFSSAHPNCAGTPGAGVPNASSLEYLRLAILPQATAYAVDFCLQIRAIP
jgi:hypothetical protein